MYQQKLAEHEREYEKQQKRIQEAKAGGKSKKDAVCLHKDMFEKTDAVLCKAKLEEEELRIFQVFTALNASKIKIGNNKQQRNRVKVISVAKIKKEGGIVAGRTVVVGNVEVGNDL